MKHGYPVLKKAGSKPNSPQKHSRKSKRILIEQYVTSGSVITQRIVGKIIESKEWL
jgi:hypothetical protein